MKYVSHEKITLIKDTDPFDNQYIFDIATDVSSFREIDIAKLLIAYRNDRVEYNRDYKLWNDVYPGEKELEVFRDILDMNIKNGQKIHISNITLREEVEIIRNIYDDLGYFNEGENQFLVDFKNTPVTIGVNIHNLIYSTKDYKSMCEKICFIPPPREPGNVKALFAGLNAGIISTIHIDNFTKDESLLRELIVNEKNNFTTISRTMYWNFLLLGFEVKKQEFIFS